MISVFFFFKQKTAYEMRISDWSSDVCSSDLSEDAEEKPKFASLRPGQSMHTISLEEALVLFQLPRTLGDLDGVPLTVGVGRFGPFVKHGSTYASLGKEDDPYTIDFERGKALLIAKAEAIANRIIKAFEEIGRAHV